MSKFCSIFAAVRSLPTTTTATATTTTTAREFLSAPDANVTNRYVTIIVVMRNENCSEFMTTLHFAAAAAAAP